MPQGNIRDRAVYEEIYSEMIYSAKEQIDAYPKREGVIYVHGIIDCLNERSFYTITEECLIFE